MNLSIEDVLMIKLTRSEKNRIPTRIQAIEILKCLKLVTGFFVFSPSLPLLLLSCIDITSSYRLKYTFSTPTNFPLFIRSAKVSLWLRKKHGKKHTLVLYSFILFLSLRIVISFLRNAIMCNKILRLRVGNYARKSKMNETYSSGLMLVSLKIDSSLL